ncbi:hypothetical protein WI23_15090 [Burkholderia oklahomensis C6786]|nr:hypothetical protein WI23_15090 [Burkholderia oklahomensis C6786]KUY59872.1 hypothetical protein WI23_14845 [Burkholderia oklahomensis C6786]
MLKRRQFLDLLAQVGVVLACVRVLQLFHFLPEQGEVGCGVIALVRQALASIGQNFLVGFAFGGWNVLRKQRDAVLPFSGEGVRAILLEQPGTWTSASGEQPAGQAVGR